MASTKSIFYIAIIVVLIGSFFVFKHYFFSSFKGETEMNNKNNQNDQEVLYLDENLIKNTISELLEQYLADKSLLKVEDTESDSASLKNKMKYLINIQNMLIKFINNETFDQEIDFLNKYQSLNHQKKEILYLFNKFNNSLKLTQNRKIRIFPKTYPKLSSILSIDKIDENFCEQQLLKETIINSVKILEIK